MQLTAQHAEGKALQLHTWAAALKANTANIPVVSAERKTKTKCSITHLKCSASCSSVVPSFMLGTNSTLGLAGGGGCFFAFCLWRCFADLLVPLEEESSASHVLRIT